MTIEELNAMGKSPEQIKQDLTKNANIASASFIEKQMKAAFNLGYKKGFAECMAQFSVDQKSLEQTLRNLGV